MSQDTETQQIPTEKKGLEGVDSTDLFGFALGETVEAADDIMSGCSSGTRLRIIGPSGNPRHPIGVAKESDPAWQIGVSKRDIRKPNVNVLARGESATPITPKPQ